ncbi:MAG: hypothetical protein FWD78_04195 [Treponema sp.]|nr:hypothetical protein [Treponema sp.]
MFRKCLLTAALILGLTAAPLFASMVSFLVVEEGLQPGSDAGDYSSLWEGGLMGAFFDAGHIVSNSPVLRVEKLSPSGENTAVPAEVQKDYLEANSGGADFFILAVLEYRLQDKKMKPFQVDIKIIRTNNGQLVYNESFPAGSAVNLQEEYLNAQQTGGVIAAQLEGNKK